MKRRPTRTRTTLALSVLALTLIAPWALGQDPDAITEIRRQAEQGDPEEQYNLGNMYINGEGVLQDDAEAVPWYRIAAEPGHAAAQFEIGLMYEEGRWVPQDDAEAVRWYRVAAEEGHTMAQLNLGFMFATGRGVQQDYLEAVRTGTSWRAIRAKPLHNSTLGSCTTMVTVSSKTTLHPCAGTA